MNSSPASPCLAVMLVIVAVLAAGAAFSVTAVPPWFGIEPYLAKLIDIFIALFAVLLYLIFERRGPRAEASSDWPLVWRFFFAVACFVSVEVAYLFVPYIIVPDVLHADGNLMDPWIRAVTVAWEFLLYFAGSAILVRMMRIRAMGMLLAAAFACLLTLLLRLTLMGVLLRDRTIFGALDECLAVNSFFWSAAVLAVLLGAWAARPRQESGEA